VVKSCPSMVNHNVDKCWLGLFPRLVLFMSVAPLVQPGVVGPSLGMGCMAPQPFATGGNRSYLELWAVTGVPWYPGYNTPIVAHELSVELVVRAGHLMVGRIGTHMILWALPWDSAMRLWG
jgi:hypothetical protein